MSRKSKRILLTLASAAVGAACGAAVYFIRKGKADLETDFGDFKDEFEEEKPAPAERTYTTLPKTKGAEDAAPDPESAACNEGSETADAEAESETAESEEEDAEKESCADDSESACEAPEAESGDDEADSCEEETTEETAGAAEETPSAADREVSPQEESEVTAE